MNYLQMLTFDRASGCGGRIAVRAIDVLRVYTLSRHATMVVCDLGGSETEIEVIGTFAEVAPSPLAVFTTVDSAGHKIGLRPFDVLRIEVASPETTKVSFRMDDGKRISTFIAVGTFEQVLAEMSKQ